MEKNRFPTLTQMGINNPMQISRFTIYETGHVDHLRVVYDRKKGSLLPASRTYHFPQDRKSVVIDSGTRTTETLYESSRSLRAAIAEIEQIAGDKKDRSGRKRALEEELRHLEHDVAERIACIRAMLDGMD